MNDTPGAEGFLMIGATALRVPMLVTQLRKLALAGKVPCRRLNQYLLFREADIPAIRAAAEQAGYVRPRPEAVA